MKWAPCPGVREGAETDVHIRTRAVVVSRGASPRGRLKRFKVGSHWPVRTVEKVQGETNRECAYHSKSCYSRRLLFAWGITAELTLHTCVPTAP